MYIKVSVTPGAKRERVLKESSTAYRMEIKEPAERNLANKRARDLLQEILGVSRSAVRLIAGHRSGRKVFDVLLEED